MGPINLMLRNLRAGFRLFRCFSHDLYLRLSHLQIQMIAILNAFDPWGQHLDHRVVLVMTSLRLRMRVIDQSCVPLIPESQPARRKGEMLGRVFGRPLNR